VELSVRARIVPADREGLAQAGELIREGRLVGMPTETVYGLAGAAFRADALTRTFAVKDRPTFDPLIVHVAFAPPTGAEYAAALADLRIVDPALSRPQRSAVEALARAFWPGPLTLVLPRHPDLPDLVAAGLPTVAVRMPRHHVARGLIAAAGTPLTAPSANRFGRVSPTCAQDVAEELGDRIELILDAGRCEVGIESTVVVVGAEGDLGLLRPGGTPTTEIEAAVGRPLRPARGGRPTGPGMLESHYAPGTPLHLLPGPVDQTGLREIGRLIEGTTAAGWIGLLLFSGDPGGAAHRTGIRLGRPVAARSLSVSGDLVEAARNLFARLRELDGLGAETILAEPCPIRAGLGHAIADRLERAQTRT
jgi:L-threonylcarbamoyladenylate synthase